MYYINWSDGTFISLNVKIIYKVTGGYKTSPFITDDLTAAYNDFFIRIRHTKPESGCTITIEKYDFTESEEQPEIELIQKVKLE